MKLEPILELWMCLCHLKFYQPCDQNRRLLPFLFLVLATRPPWAVAAHAPLPPGRRARRQPLLPPPPPSPPSWMMGVPMSSACILVPGEAGALPAPCKHWSRRSVPCSVSPMTSKLNPCAPPTSVSPALLQHRFLSHTCRSKCPCME
jgi:hypothetical protein